jgi:hypothetical protein
VPHPSWTLARKRRNQRRSKRLETLVVGFTKSAVTFIYSETHGENGKLTLAGKVTNKLSTSVSLKMAERNKQKARSEASRQKSKFKSF